MRSRRLSFLPLACTAPLLGAADAPDSVPGIVEYAQVTIHERVIIRIPRMDPRRAAAASGVTGFAPPAAAATATRPVEWTEKKAPRCVPAASLTGAHMGREGEVDLVVDGGRRMRAKLDAECPTLQFYSGFYLKPAADGMVCAGRDAIRSRSGARCEIARFRTLVAR